MKLSGLSPLMARREEGGLSYDHFRADPALASLHWPGDVLEQFLLGHGDNAAFVYDYGSIDLHEVRWRLDTIPAADFIGMPTGASDAGCIESYAENPVHWVNVRRPEVGRHWEEHGRWLRPPILIVRRLLDPSDSGPQGRGGQDTRWCAARPPARRAAPRVPPSSLGPGTRDNASPNTPAYAASV
ncbi:hypothetical protein AB0D24_25530 [Streptomyces javensis]|uniref:hypothetical protein n=1 Tax=Streptomyces javensis TaxID=114698 RepID=UPI00340D9528